MRQINKDSETNEFDLSNQMLGNVDTSFNYTTPYVSQCYTICSINPFSRFGLCNYLLLPNNFTCYQA